MLYILINDYILKVKKNKKYSFPENRGGLDIGCGYNLIDSFIGLDGNFLIYLMKKKLPRIIKEKNYSGIIRDLIFTSECTDLIIRTADKFQLIGDIITFLDNISLKLFGHSQIIVVAQKK